jgi:maltooligosyltrehalose trehalohydrolase
MELVDLEPEEHGYFSGFLPEAKPGMLYKFRLSTGSFPDPASRFQPDGPHGPSQIIAPERFIWTDQGWQGVPRNGQVLYEMHLGTFTREGTLGAATAELAELKNLGITVIELMPVADFVGRFGWGYDGVNLFAPSRLYGSPDELRAFINRAHELGLGVILDVVYNHLGPDGNYLKEFSPDYFTDRYANEWGDALNFDGNNSGPVREFFTTNASYWTDEFHFDGLRLDATQQIFDASTVHILAEISQAVRSAARGRATFIAAENEPQHTRLVRAPEDGGFGLNALWNDDFHHSACVALTGRSEAYYSGYRGCPQEFISAIKWGYLYQGQWYAWQRQRRGTPAWDITPDRFVTFLENHDQVANSLYGARLHQLTDPGRLRSLTGLLLLAPATPMLFQGQEFASSAPFLYFADHNPNLSRLVANGRRDFLHQFRSIARPESESVLADPGSPETFLRCKLDLTERQKHRHFYELHRELLRLRREDPVFSLGDHVKVDGAVLGPEAFVLRFFGGIAQDRLLIVNLGLELELESIAEPLLAPFEGCWWNLLWSSEEPRFGGLGTPEVTAERCWHIPGHASVVLQPVPLQDKGRVDGGETDPSNRSETSTT